VVIALAVLLLGIYAVSSGSRAYGHMSDEYYYLDCASRLAWGYVDHPPLSIAALALVKSALGSSLLALRLLPALVACLNVLLVALLARELGGGRAAQSLAALAAATTPVYLAGLGFYSMNSFEPAFWSGAMLLLARIANGGDARLWLALGVVLGLGLLNKISVLWLGAGLALGIAATPQRRWLATPWPYACAAIALLVFAPHLVWQVQNGWPTLEFMRNARDLKMVDKSPVDFAFEQVLVMSPAAVPVWLAGLFFYFTPRGRPHRWLAWIWIAVMALLMASGTARSNYSGPAYAALLAGGGVAIEAWARRGLRRLVPALLGVLILVVGLGVAPLAVPLLPPAELVRYSDALGIAPPRDEQEATGPLPLHFALRFGWQELVQAVAAAADTLTPGERINAVVLAPNFGAAGALNFHRRARSLPPAVSGHNNYWLWGPGETDGEVILAVAEDAGELERAYRSVVAVADVDCELCRPEVARYRVYVCRGLRRPLAELWRDLERYI
jgi:4-amino-4-deoxy-L-arabinose transferase-like glycosyltransferase